MFITTILLFIGLAEAKSEKIKYGKFVYYEGEVVNEQPVGDGCIVFLSPTNNLERVAVISGKFQGNNIFKAEITSNLLPSIKTIGINPIKFETQGKIGKVEAFDFDFSNVSFLNDSTEYTFIDLNIALSICDKKWKMNWISDPIMPDGNKTGDNEIIVITKKFPIPENIAEYWHTVNNVWVGFYLNGGKLKLNSPIFYEFNDAIYDCGSHRFFNYEYTPLKNKVYFKILPNKTWSGTRIIEDSKTKIIGNDKQVSIYLNDSIHYKGSLMDPMLPVSQSFTYNSIIPKTGTLFTSSGNKRIVNGITEDIMRSRLEEDKIDNDLIEDVISGKNSEAYVKLQQQKRNAQKLEAEYEELKLAEILKSKWNCKEILFSGPIQGSKEGDEVLAMLFNLDHTYIDGEVALALQSDGEGAFAVVAVPSKKAGNLSRPKAMQLLGACEKISKHITGRWSIQGNDILINGKKVATLSPDNKTVKYEGMVGAIMKITIKK